MNNSRDVSPLRPLIFGGLVGLLLGLAIGLFYAWSINPVTYAGGSFPNELTDSYQQTYTGAVAEAYLTNRDANKAAARLTTFSAEEKVALLASSEADFRNNNLINEANGVADLATQLQAQEGWTAEAISAGLSAGGASPEFAQALGQVAQPTPGGQPPAAQEPADPESSSVAGNIARIFLWVLLVVLVIAIVFILLTRIKINRRSSSPVLSPELQAWDGSGPQPLRQWVGTFSFGQDNYDESFTVETPESDFLGECGMGILEGFSGGSPRRVMAFDVWLFDKTDIRTVSMPIMSKYAFEDDNLRAKLPSDATPILAAEGQTFDIETTALIVNAKIEEISYGDEPPEMSYFTNLKVSLTAYLKPDVDVSGAMPIPEGLA
jgi:hypothetical protein